MARPTVIRNEVILDAARTIFLERGILATSAEVAQRAGVSEGSIFKRFKTKAELFRAAMGVDVEEMPNSLAHLVSLVGKNTVEQNLVEVGVSAVRFFERVMPIVMMSWSNPKVHPCLSGGLDVADPPPLRAQRYLAEYFTAEMALGRIAPVDPHVIARAYFGALTHFVFSEMLAGQHGGMQIDREEYVREFVSTLMRGMTKTKTRSLRPEPLASQGASDAA